MTETESKKVGPRKAVLAARLPKESRNAQAKRLGIPEPSLRKIERINKWASNPTIRAAQMKALGVAP
jgi:hypothetical protein